MVEEWVQDLAEEIATAGQKVAYFEVSGLQEGAAVRLLKDWIVEQGLQRI